MPTNSANFSNRSKYYLGNVGKVSVTGGEVFCSHYDEESEVLYLGGNFSTVNGQARSGFAAIKPDTSLLDVTANVNPGAAVYSIKIDSGSIYIGGSFTEINVSPMSYLAQILPTGLVSSFGPSLNGIVRDLEFRGLNDIIVVGDFTRANNFIRSGVAILDQGGELLTSSISLDPGKSVNKIAYAEDTGETFLAGSQRYVNGITKFGVLDSSFSDSGDTFRNLIDGGTVRDFFYDGNGFYLVGNFTQIKDRSVSGAAYISSTGEIGSWMPVIAGGTVVSVVVDQASQLIYLGGTFTSVNGVSRNRLACVNFSGTLQAWNPDANGTVSKLLLDSGTIYIGGSFTTIGANTRNRAAAVSSAGALLSWNPDANDTVFALAKLGTSILIGGNFTTVSGGTISRLRFCRVDPASGSVLDSSTFNIALNGGVADIKVVNVNGTDQILIGGAFTSISSNTYFVQGTGTVTQSNLSTRRFLRAASNAQVIERYSSTDIPVVHSIASRVSGVTLEISVAGNVASGSIHSIFAIEPITTSMSKTIIDYTSPASTFVHKIEYIEALSGYAAAGSFDRLSPQESRTLSRVSGTSSLGSLDGRPPLSGNLIGKDVKCLLNKVYVVGDFRVSNSAGANAYAIDLSLEGVSSDWSTPWKPKFSSVPDSVSISSDGSLVAVSGSFNAYTPFFSDTSPNTFPLDNFGVFNSSDSFLHNPQAPTMNRISMQNKSVLCNKVSNGFMQVVSLDNTSQANSVRVWDTRYDVPRN